MFMHRNYVFHVLFLHLHRVFQLAVNTGTAYSMGDPIDSAFQSRRFAHGKSKSKGKGKAGAKPFNPLSTLGSYDVSLNPGVEMSQQVFEIHELTEDETGLIGTFNLGKLSGMFVLCGSRSGLEEVVAGFEEKDEDQDEDDNDNEDDAEDEDDDSESRESDDAEESGTELSAIELADEKANRRARAFEKNSFRNPKFWMRWKGFVTASKEDGANEGQKHVESDMGYLVFANNSCDRFQGTISCPSLGWQHLKMKGRKMTPKATPRPLTWNDIS